MNLYNELEQLCKVVEYEMARVNEKLEHAGGEMSGDDISYIDKITHALKSIKATMAMMDAEGGEYSRGYGDNYRDGGNYGEYSESRYNDGGRYSEGRYSDGYGAEGYGRRYSARGRGRNARRDSMGRYADGGDMTQQLESLMESAPDEKTRQEIQKIVQKMRGR